MKRNTGKFQENSKLLIFENKFNQVICIVFFVLVMLNFSILAQTKESNIEEAVGNFLETWLIKHDVDGAISFISEHPVFPKCWAEKEDGLEWRKTRAGVVKIVEPFFKRVSQDIGKINTLGDLIESPKEKFKYGILKSHKFSSQFDLYEVDQKLRTRIIRDATYSKCENPDGGSSKFVAQGIKKQRELYLIYLYFKPSDLLTMVWIKENGKFRLFNLEFHV